jgi:hypothetical protein
LAEVHVNEGDIDVAVTFASEINDPGVELVGPLPREISTPTALGALTISTLFVFT